MTKKKEKNKPRILLFDIENAPNMAYIWSCWQDGIPENMIASPWYMLCWCAKWLNEKEMFSSALVDFPQYYKKHPEDDKKVLKALWNLLDEADIVIAHNAKKFDVRKTNARFIMNGMTPPSTYKIVDTLVEARKNFFFTSNKLDNLGKYLGVGKKLPTGGFSLWEKCMAGQKTAWKRMVKYCKRDVIVLEKVYKKLLPYIQTHPNCGVYMDDNDRHCPKCGSTKVIKRGFKYTNVSQFQQYQCKSCGAWSRGRTNLRTKKNNNKVQNTN